MSESSSAVPSVGPETASNSVGGEGKVREHEWPCEHADGGAGACEDSNCPAFPLNKTAPFGMWARERARRDIAKLEDAWYTIADYAERHDLIVTSEGLSFFLGMLTEDGPDPRAKSAIDAMEWLRSEMKRTETQLKVFEAQGISDAPPSEKPASNSEKTP